MQAFSARSPTSQAALGIRNDQRSVWKPASHRQLRRTKGGRRDVFGENRAVEPSPWVVRFASPCFAARDVLDVACGAGRHTRLFLALVVYEIPMDGAFTAE
jgi:hypothetical protein